MLARVGIIKLVILINCNLITFVCNCNSDISLIKKFNVINYMVKNGNN